MRCPFSTSVVVDAGRVYKTHPALPLYHIDAMSQHRIGWPTMSTSDLGRYLSTNFICRYLSAPIRPGVLPDCSQCRRASFHQRGEGNYSETTAFPTVLPLLSRSFFSSGRSETLSAVTMESM